MTRVSPKRSPRTAGTASGAREAQAGQAAPAPRPISTIWRLAWPQMLMMFFNFLIGFVDILVAGRIDSTVQAAMGMVNSLLFFFLVIATAVANGAVAAVSQSMGAGLRRRVQRYIGLVLVTGVLSGLCIFLVGLPIKHPVLAMLQVPKAVAPVMDVYYDVFLLLLPFYYVFIVCNALFRAQKRVMEPLYVIVLATIVNTIGDLGLGLGWWGFPNMGYRGLAWSTFGSITAGMCLDIWLLRRRGMLTAEAFPPLRWARKALPYIVKVAWPGGLMQVVWNGAYLVLFAIVGSLPVGSVPALAGMSAGLRVESFLFLPGVAFNMTASILVGQYLGQGRPDLAKSYGFKVLALGVVSMSVAAVAVWHWVAPLAAFIAPDPAVARQCVSYLSYNLLAIPFTLTTMTMAGALTGAGATLYILLAFGGASWLVRLPLAWLLGHVVMGNSRGVWLAMLLSQGLQAVIVLYIFAYKDWSRFSLVRRRKNNGD
ncbi:MATE efflux family protein [Desulfovibrio sp. X2]|uniref:MATE family efflux transporter n=1 Tax=Desulfovibrio sp. X2 TaxID=941449 RepID=UPI000358B4F1|nr:MATE family efflux transporter [Desulfovibrio sp. X2]EPR44520.1 MATE efflux family protein [Desulfovibrio sp. X2]